MASTVINVADKDFDLIDSPLDISKNLSVNFHFYVFEDSTSLLSLVSGPLDSQMFNYISRARKDGDPPNERTPLISSEVVHTQYSPSPPNAPTGSGTNENPTLNPEEADEHQSASPSYGDSPEQKPTASVVGVLIVILIGTFVANIDATFVITTHGTIATEFLRFPDASWVLSCYTLAMCATQPLYGKLSNIYGRRSVLAVSYSLFALGCLICGTAVTYHMVLLGRVLSGFGGAGMAVLASILITDLVPLRQVASWRSYLNVFATTGRSIGGPVGGFLADTIGWRWYDSSFDTVTEY
jgi:hypothetical protein